MAARPSTRRPKSQPPDKMIWAYLIHLSLNMGTRQVPYMRFHSRLWRELLKKLAEAGVNTVVVDVALAGVNRMFYVDFDGGDDTNHGRSAAAAWKHCPGDANAIGTAAGTALGGGESRPEGVRYRCEWPSIQFRFPAQDLGLPVLGIDQVSGGVAKAQQSAIPAARTRQSAALQ